MFVPSLDNSDTICAIATAEGGALGIVRISGSESFRLVQGVSPDVPEHPCAGRFRLCRIMDGDALLDEAIVSFFRAPHSYTGEDAVEVSCHGSSYILERLIQLLVDGGARIASPGEFTQRAFTNGRLDLSQAEAVADLISAQSRAAHDVAINQLRGGFSSQLYQLRERLLKLTSLLELELDFSDHDDLQFADRSELLVLADTIDSHLLSLADSFQAGQAIRQGIPVVLVGETNVGKSTLLNRLLGEERAIVSDIHGTTRDTIEETLSLHGVQFRFIDTAGLRSTDDPIEQCGIERTHDALQRARVIVWITDQRPSNSQIDEMRQLAGTTPLITVQNKADLLSPAEQEPWTCPMLFISARKGIGISELKEQVFRAARIPDLDAMPVVVTSVRHYDALLRARADLQRAIRALQGGLSADLVSEDLRAVLHTLGEITGGEITSSETLAHIFQHFCVGK